MGADVHYRFHKIPQRDTIMGLKQPVHVVTITKQPTNKLANKLIN
jgi:hypothetical protein